MKVNCLSNEPSLVTVFLNELRNVKVQTDSMRFRRNIERLGEIMAYEISKTLCFKEESLSTPLAQMMTKDLADKVVVASILRAGLPLHQGVLNFFDHAENAFISAYRKYSSETEFTIHTEYLASPRLDDKVLIIADPMLATGSSMLTAYEAFLQNGKPKQVVLASVLATPEAIRYLEKALPADVRLFVCAIDEGLNEHKYILPGLGDAGDLAFGVKE